MFMSLCYFIFLNFLFKSTLCSTDTQILTAKCPEYLDETEDYTLEISIKFLRQAVVSQLLQVTSIETKNADLFKNNQDLLENRQFLPENLTLKLGTCEFTVQKGQNSSYGFSMTNFHKLCGVSVSENEREYILQNSLQFYRVDI